MSRTILIIAVCAACTLLERALPFLIFRSGRVPPLVQYLGKVLPLAVMMTLVVYCLRSVSFQSTAGFLPQTIALTVVTVLHLWRKNAFLSIFGGTACYMLLVQLAFA